LDVAPEDPIFGLKRKVAEDTTSLKVDMGLGAYMDETGKQPVWKAVRMAEDRIVGEKLDKDYLSLLGNEEYIRLSQELIFGADHPKYLQKAIATGQTISGTGALRLAGEFLKLALRGEREFYLPKETWPNHNTIFRRAGWDCKAFPYYDHSIQGIAFEQVLDAMRNAATGAVFLFHACSMNPTATDPTTEQWDAIADVAKENGIFILIDCAYLGWASGSMDQDAYGIRTLASKGVEIVVCQSYSKNLAIYGERAGAIHIVCNSNDDTEKVKSLLRSVIRPLWSNCPLHGTRIVLKVLGDSELRRIWLEEFQKGCQRLVDVRKELHGFLVNDLKTPGKWDFILKQQGYFIFTDFTREECLYMEETHHIYNLKTGRFSLCGVNPSNIKRVAEVFDEVTRQRK